MARESILFPQPDRPHTPYPTPCPRQRGPSLGVPFCENRVFGKSPARRKRVAPATTHSIKTPWRASCEFAGGSGARSGTKKPASAAEAGRSRFCMKWFLEKSYVFVTRTRLIVRTNTRIMDWSHGLLRYGGRASSFQGICARGLFADPERKRRRAAYGWQKHGASNAA